MLSNYWSVHFFHLFFSRVIDFRKFGGLLLMIEHSLQELLLQLNRRKQREEKTGLKLVFSLFDLLFLPWSSMDISGLQKNLYNRPSLTYLKGGILINKKCFSAGHLSFLVDLELLENLFDLSLMRTLLTLFSQVKNF